MYLSELISKLCTVFFTKSHLHISNTEIKTFNKSKALNSIFTYSLTCNIIIP